jgi:glycosyltransferase involved in cell wall biosynthesis
MKVSVIIPVYNHAAYLRQRIDSILNQTFKDFEIILLDDYSTDNSREIITDYTSNHPEIKCIFNTYNSGNPFSQWDKGVRESSGEFLWIAESDDDADPSFLEKSVALLEQNKNAGLVYCDSKVIDEKKGIEYLSSDWKKRLHPTRWQTGYVNDGVTEIVNYLYKQNRINNVSGVLFRREKYIEAGYADHSMRYCGDWFLYLRILLKSGIVYNSEPLNTYRIHAKSTSMQYYSDNNYMKEVLRIYKFLRLKVSLSLYKKVLMTFFVLNILQKRLISKIIR